MREPLVSRLYAGMAQAAQVLGNRGLQVVGLLSAARCQGWATGHDVSTYSWVFTDTQTIMLINCTMSLHSFRGRIKPTNKQKKPNQGLLLLLSLLVLFPGHST